MITMTYQMTKLLESAIEYSITTDHFTNLSHGVI
jgi:hypothetical protein